MSMSKADILVDAINFELDSNGVPDECNFKITKIVNELADLVDDMVPNIDDFLDHHILCNPYKPLTKDQVKLAEAFIKYRVLHFQMGCGGGRTTAVKSVNHYLSKFTCDDVGEWEN